jgi:hypothetical protein
MFLLNPTLWRDLGTRKIWVSFGVGFEGGKWYGRRAKVVGPLPSYWQENSDRINLCWNDHRAQVRQDIVPIRHLHPAAPIARDREGVVLTGRKMGEVVRVQKYLRKTKTMQVTAVGGVGLEVWEEPEGNLCWVE